MPNIQQGTLAVNSPLNLTGVLFQQTNPETPLFNRLPVYSTNHRQFVMGASYDLAAPREVSISEDVSVVAPVPTKHRYTNNWNTTQIFQRSVQETYRSMGNSGELIPLTASGSYINTYNPAAGSFTQPGYAGQTNNRPNKLATEQAMQIAEMRRDMEWAILNNTFGVAGDSYSVDRTRGLIEYIKNGYHHPNNPSTPTGNNVLDGNSEELSYDMICTLGEMLTKEYADGLDRVTFLITAAQARQLSKFIVNSDKFVSNQTQFGANAMQVLTPFGVANFLRLSDKFLNPGTVVAADLNVMSNVIQPIPGKGFFFYEELAKVGASEQGHIYGEWGVDLGPCEVHGLIEGVADTTEPTRGGTAVYVVNANEIGV